MRPFEDEERPRFVAEVNVQIIEEEIIITAKTTTKVHINHKVPVLTALAHQPMALQPLSDQMPVHNGSLDDSNLREAAITTATEEAVVVVQEGSVEDTILDEEDEMNITIIT